MKAKCDHYFMRLLCVLLLCMSQVLHAQTGYHSEWYNVDNGLLNNSAKDLGFDNKTGLLWIGTEGGLSSFNGSRFRHFTNQNTAAISAIRMDQMTTGPQGGLYILTEDEKVLTIRGDEPVLYLSHPFKKLDAPIYSFLSLEVSRIFYDKLNDTSFHDLIALNQQSLCNKVSDSACIFTSPAALSLYIYIDPASGRLSKVSLPFIARAAFNCGGKTYLVNGAGGVRQVAGSNSKIWLKPATGIAPQVKQLLTQGRVFKNDGQEPLVAFLGKYYLLSDSNQTISAKLVGESLPDMVPYQALYVAAVHRLFIGTLSQGLLVISPHLLQTIHTKRSTSANVLLPDVCYNQLVIDAHHILNHNGEVFGNGSRPVAAPPRLKTQTGPHFYDFDELGVWYLYGDSVYHYDKASRVNEAVFSLHFFPTLSMCRLGDSIVYVNKSDINIIYKKKVTKLFTYWPVEKRTTYIFNIALQNKEVLLIATKELLLRYHFSSHTIDTLMNTGPLSIRSLYKYGDYVFAGSYGQGYFCIKGNVIKHMPLDKNKYLRFAHCLRVGSDGICRISTNNGLFCASIKDMLEAYEHNLPEIYYQHLNKQDGMDNNEMNGGCAPCAVTLPDGTTSFPSMEGLVWVRPDMSAILSHSYPITISSIEADGTLYKPAYFENHELPFGTEEAIIHFNYSGWNGTASTYISYQLNDQPFKQWDAATEKVIHLYKPGSGEFNMLLKQLDGFGVNHFSTARIHFRVAYPWYRTFYFYISCLLVLAGVILLSVRLSNHLLVKKKKKLEHLVKEKTTELEYKNEQLLKDSEVNRRVISVINHDILTPLRFMHTTAAEIIKNKLLIPEATKDELIEEISLTGMKLEELAIDILNLMRFQFHGNLVEKESFNLHKSMNDLYLQAKPLLQKKQLSFTNNIPVDTTVFLQKNILRIILYNLVMNAIKFSKQGTITVGCMQNSQQVCITIEDQGIGMSAERIAHITTASYVLPGFDTARKKGVGLGYIIIRDLIKLMKGEMNIDSSSVKGTLIKLTFEN